VRSWNVASVSAYVARLAEATRPTAGEEVLDRKALFMECLFLGLRSEGVNLARLRNEFGVDFLNGNDAELQTLLTERLARLDNDVLSLTPAGYLLCDEICARLTVSAS
jgi:coproporphyrinogen III oxidase-like Fe-S oxidoreductase